MLKLAMIFTFSTNEYCKMILIYGECERQVRVTQRLFRQRFIGEPHPSRQVIE